MLSAELAITLQKIKIYALERKAYFLRGGRGLPQTALPDCPQYDDYIEGKAIIIEEPAITTTEESSKGTKSLEDRIASVNKKDSNQIDIDEAISDAENSKTTKSEHKQKRQSDNKKKLDAYLASKNAWRIQKWRNEFEYNRQKQEVQLVCDAYDDVIKYIDSIIKKGEEDDNAATTTPVPATL